MNGHDLNNNQSVSLDMIRFQMLSNAEIRSLSVINDSKYGITQSEVSGNGKNTILDPRLGTTDSHRVCEKCNQDINRCPGHFGHTELAVPIFNYAFIEIARIVLGCVCLNCSKILITKKNQEEVMYIIRLFKGHVRLTRLRNVFKGVKRCQRPDVECGCPVPVIKKAVKGNFGLIAEYMDEQNEGEEERVTKGKKKVENLDAKRVYGILRNISDEDMLMLGFNPELCRIENVIMKVYPIPPLAIRPSVRTSVTSSSNFEDTLISQIQYMVKTNNDIRKELDRDTGVETKRLTELTTLLQCYALTLYNNDQKNMPKLEQKISGKQMKSISERLTGKTGLIRGSMMGKRVDYSARTVITSDPNLSLDELGIPIKIAMTVTYPEKVNPQNIDELTRYVRNGTEVYPGANYVIPAGQNGSAWNLKFVKGYKLKIGDIVERHMINGDPTIFNRQPSLHKLSMQCHRANIINDKSLNTFRINVSVTTPYNADFDKLSVENKGR